VIRFVYSYIRCTYAGYGPHAAPWDKSLRQSRGTSNSADLRGTNPWKPNIALIIGVCIFLLGNNYLGLYVKKVDKWCIYISARGWVEDMDFGWFRQLLFSTQSSKPMCIALQKAVEWVSSLLSPTNRNMEFWPTKFDSALKLIIKRK
jgi:hypothetical protein